MRPTSDMHMDEQAAASSIAFMVAGVIFVGSLGALLVVSRDSASLPTGDSANAATLGLQAQTLADLLVGSPGLSAGSLVGWNATTADQLQRLGLRETYGPQMDFDKFQILRRAGYESNASDGRVNYPDALASLGLEDRGLDFHLRAFPSLKSVRDLLAQGYRDPNLNVTYVADYVKQTGGSTQLPTFGTLACTPNGASYTLSNTVTNTGNTTTVFIAIYEAELGSADEYEDRSRSFELAPGNSTTLSIDVPAKSGRACSGEVHVQLRDVKSKLKEYEYDLTSGGTAPTTVAVDLSANPSKTYYVQGEVVLLEFDGDLPGNNDPPVTLNLSVARDGGAVVWAQNITVTKNVRSVTVPASAFNAATTHAYTATLSYPAHGVAVTDRINVIPTGTISEFVPSGSSVSYAPGVAVAAEAGFLEDLVDNFCPYLVTSTASPVVDVIDLNKNDQSDGDETYAGRCAFKASQPGLSPAQTGDVLPDQHDEMNDLLPARLVDPSQTGYVKQCNGNIQGTPRFDITRVLVVGSNVDHNAMTSGAAKYAVCEWVMAGGTLVVFGSQDQAVQWLQPIFHAAIASSSSALSTPDQGHPILNRADALSYTTYDEKDRVWSFNGQTAAEQDQLMTNVVASGDDSVLTISNPGAFGDGTIILTTWLPYDLFGSGGAEQEGLKLVNNFLMQGYRDLFLDYGPQIPLGTQVAAAQRVVDIQHPKFAQPITLTLFVYVF